MTLALVIMGPVAALEQPLPLLGFQRGRYYRRGNTLNYYSQLPSEPPLKGRSTRSIGKLEARPGAPKQLFYRHNK